MYVNLFNFLFDLVEAIRIELALNVGCKASSKKFTNKKAAGWLDPMTGFTKMHLERQGLLSAVSEAENSSSSENASLAVSAVCYWYLFCILVFLHLHLTQHGASICTLACPSDGLLCVVQHDG